MRNVLFAALAGLALAAGPAFADSERYPEGESRMVQSAHAVNDTGSEAPFDAALDTWATESNVVAGDVGAEHLPVFAGQRAVLPGAGVRLTNR